MTGLGHNSSDTDAFQIKGKLANPPIVNVNHTHILMKRSRLLNLQKGRVSATPVPSSVCGWNNNDEHYIAEN